MLERSAEPKTAARLPTAGPDPRRYPLYVPIEEGSCESINRALKYPGKYATASMHELGKRGHEKGWPAEKELRQTILLGMFFDKQWDSLALALAARDLVAAL
jgi:hypothetical protein